MIIARDDIGVNVNIRNYLKKIYRILLRLKGGMGWKAFGLGTYLKKPIRIIGKKYVSIGRDVSILDHARIEAWPNIYMETPSLIIGNEVSIEQNFHCVVTGRLEIGSNSTISANVYISDCNHNYKAIDTDVCKQGLTHVDTFVGDYCFIGFGAVILPGVHLGKQCIVGANSVVVPGVYDDYSVLVGAPAKVVKRYNKNSQLWEKQD